MNEPRSCREARVLREMRRFLTDNAGEMDKDTLMKLHKVINVRMLNILDATHATP
jgi:hypothetical protein